MSVGGRDRFGRVFLEQVVRSSISSGSKPLAQKGACALVRAGLGGNVSQNG